MRRAFAVLMVSCLACSSASARPRHWYTNWKWWAGEAAIVGSLVADGRSTCLGYSRGLVEANPLARGTRSCASAVSILLTAGTVYTGLHVESYRTLENDPSKAWRAVSLVSVPAVVCAFHCTIAARNYDRLPER